MSTRKCFTDEKSNVIANQIKGQFQEATSHIIIIIVEEYRFVLYKSAVGTLSFK